MMPDAFMLDSGFLSNEEAITEDHRSALNEAAELYLRAGGLVDFALWRTLGTESKAAFVRANERIWRTRASLIGMASLSEVHAAFVEDEEAGYRAASRVRLARALDAVEGRLKIRR